MAQITLNSTGVASNGALVLQSNGTTAAVTVDTSQNVGIGTSSPTTPLTVSKTGVDAGLGIFNIARIRDGSSNKGVSIGYLAGSNTAVFTSESTGAASAFGWEVYSGSAWSQAMTLDASGNLGVGTTSPDIFSRGYSRILGVSSASSNSAIVVNSATGNGAFIEMGVNATRLFSIFSDASSSGISTITALPLFFATNNTERARIDSSGNLGVGVTSNSFRINATVASGANRDIFGAQISGVSNGFTIKWDHATTTTRVNISNLPTSATGLASGDLYVLSGVLMVA
jgi:hypothetical protein